jgi:hypothetical protein
MTDNDDTIAEIIQGIFDFKVIPFFGSGMSARFGIKTWGELIDSLKDELNTKTSDYLDVAQEYENAFGRERLINKIFSETGEADFKDDDLGVHYEILAMSPPIIYTTNWDNAIETATKRLNRKYTKIASLKDIIGTPHYSNVIIKFHGDFESPENIVFTRNDYKTRMAIQHPLDILFRAHILGKKVLFLGYSFSDENIDFIFSKHQELYGTTLLPKSYIISFKEKYNPTRAKQLEEKNIQTIVLESAKQLEELIRKLNQSVFEQDIKRQNKNIFKSRPSEVLLKSDLQNLKEYILSSNHSGQQMADKYREVVELKTMSQDVEKQLSEFLVELINLEIPMELKSALLLTFPHLQFREIKSLFDVAIEMIDWTKHDELNYNVTTMSVIDVLSTIESRLTPKPTCCVIFLFLVKARENKTKLTEKQLQRIFEMLRDCDWENIGDIKGFELSIQQEILNEHISQYPSLKTILKARHFPGLRRTRSQLIKDMEEMMGKNLTDTMDEDL